MIRAWLESHGWALFGEGQWIKGHGMYRIVMKTEDALFDELTSRDCAIGPLMGQLGEAQRNAHSFAGSRDTQVTEGTQHEVPGSSNPFFGLASRRIKLLWRLEKISASVCL